MLPVIRKIRLDRYPFRAFGDFFDDCCQPTAQAQKNDFGSLDVYEDATSLHVDAELPGFNQDQIDLTLEEGVLQISAERDVETEDKENNYHLRERRSGKWSRSIQLPVSVQDDKVTASYNDGVLKVTLEKQQAQQTRKIKIN